MHSTPIGFNDAYTVLGNVRIQVPDGASDLLANDTDPENTGNSTRDLQSRPSPVTIRHPSRERAPMVVR